MNIAEYKDASYLAHHGIKGQKWGVRKYQNEDGSLTDAGRRRYLSGDGLTKKGQKFAKQLRSSQGEEYRKEIDRQDSIYNKKLIAARKTLEDYEKSSKDPDSESYEWWSKRDKLADRVYAEEGKAKYDESALAGALLKDIGQKDTDAGRRVVQDILSRYYKS